ncbi:hypothetical protein EON65_36765 [archaeon]|nr:MAG: hypothetical protein EON65_36765 [archaeon]
MSLNDGNRKNRKSSLVNADTSAFSHSLSRTFCMSELHHDQFTGNQPSCLVQRGDQGTQAQR